MSKVFSAPKAYIEIDSVPAGFIQNLSWSENFQRQSVTGLGSLIEQEAPVVSQRNTFNIGTFFISLDDKIVKKIMNRDASVEEFIQTMSLDEFTFSIVVYRKKITAEDKSVKLVTSIDKTGETVVRLRDCVLDSQNWSIAEGGIAMFNVTGRYFTPITIK